MEPLINPYPKVSTQQTKPKAKSDTPEHRLQTFCEREDVVPASREFRVYLPVPTN